MTLLRYDRFAFFPKRCNECNRLFVYEQYNLKYKRIGDYYSYKTPICKECVHRQNDKSQAKI